MANTINVNDVHTIINAIAQQATGRSIIAPVDSSGFVTVATTLEKTGFNQTYNAISEVLGRTIFSMRPYSRKFKGLDYTNEEWGNFTRKITPIDTEAIKPEEWELKNGTAVDMFKPQLNQLLQTNLYGSNAYVRQTTRTREQIKTALRSESEFSSFWSMLVQNASDLIEQDKETTNRLTLANLIAGVISANAPATVRHLFTEYKAHTGLTTLKPNDIYKPEYYKDFMLWAMGEIAIASDNMTDRTTLYHSNIVGKTVTRHTPYDKQRLYFYTPNKRHIEFNAFTNIFNPDFVKLAITETVNFWQNPQEPGSIEVKPAWMHTDGTIKTLEEPKKFNNIFAVLTDVETAGVNWYDEYTESTPVNALGSYYNTFYHFRARHFNDFTENAIVFLLD